ncbi:hypothetical protein [Aestuariivivens sp. NBU2969]|uniref:hypothetical protein n=1 Tax=Aestuariivivens sp. NBU2969 TaxID=2873267 RepID=UPI001CBAAAEA|nr:hypothetical protein [Aestuariivivens sp. NBU2969]
MKPIYLFSLFILFLSCNQRDTSKSDNKTDQPFIKTVNQSDLSKINYTEFVLSPEAQRAIENWVEYNQLQEQVGYLKKGDLSFFNDNKKAIETLLKDLNKNIPEDLKDNSILARLKVVETTIYKLESLVQLSTTTKPELIEGIKAFLISVSNLDLQLNEVIELRRYENIPKP